jgi:WD40 repeat protein
MRRLTGTPAAVRCLAFSPDGRALASGGDERQTARLWDVVTGDPGGRVTTAAGWLSAVAFAPDGRTLATAGFSQWVQCWEVEGHAPTGRQWDLDASAEPVRAVAFQTPTKLVAGGDFQRLGRWELLTQRRTDVVVSYAWGARSLALAPAAARMAVGYSGGDACVIDLMANRLIWSERFVAGPVRSVSLSADGDKLALATGQAVHLRTGLTSRVERRLTVPPGPITGLAFAPAGNLLVGSGRDGAVRLWDVGPEGLRERFCVSVSAGPLLTAAFSPDGLTVAAAGAGGEIWVLDVDE